MTQYKYIIDSLVSELDEERYEHTLGVAYTAASLAMRYEEDINKAILAGLLHDVSKRCKSDKYIEMCNAYDIFISEAEYKNPGLLHAKLSAYIASNEYDVEDNEILSAIESHTTGKPNMTMLEKIIYIADYIEPLRNKQKHLLELRKLAFIDIDKALLMILEDTVEYLKSTNKVIDPTTYETYLFYKGKIND
ncbi:MAG: bis(5'-nucleosyl)-tetraphosphatase (symmetrical) YqeK [Firmicutes bacterium]|nr:bis(5'-nucleosyl)-tetraphosphatase (symmetrical) YqeK [Candidatus Colivicinus equi]